MRHCGPGRYLKIALFCASVLVIFAVPAGPAAAAGSACGSPPLVWIDIGHTPARAGAVSARGVGEYHYNRRLALELAEALGRVPGLTVSVMNEKGANQPMRQRLAKIRSLKRGMMISVHHDSAQLKYFKTWTFRGKRLRYSDVFSGHSLFVSSRSPQFKKSAELGKKVGRALRAAGLVPTLHHNEPIKGENRKFVDKDLGLYDFPLLAVLRRTAIPAVLIEAGLIVNRQEELKLSTDGYRARIVEAVASGIAEYCGLK